MDNLLIREYGKIKRQELNTNPYSCLDSEKIDINPHQIEAFMFTLSAIRTGGAILADEVGLGKTIEAGIVLKYLLKNGYKKILLIMPASLRKQWQIELEEKFSIDTVILDSQNFDSYYEFSKREHGVLITSYNFAAKRREFLSKISWDFMVFDEAHRLRNIHKNSNKTANKIYELSKGIPKLMLTATPMQNTLLDMFGLVQFIDDKIFLDKRVFSQKYIKNQDYAELKIMLEPVLQRTLRSEVADYLQFKSRIGISVDFSLTPMEAILYKLVNDYLKKNILYAIPSSNRSLITIVIRKLLASSSSAVVNTFEVLKERLQKLKETTRTESVDKSLDYFFDFLDDDFDEEEAETEETVELYDRDKVNEFIQHEIDEIDEIITVANKIQTNAKLNALKKALQIAFSRQRKMGISEKVVVFTESVRTQSYLFEELSVLGYDDSMLMFNGNMSDNKTKEIYRAWKSKNYGKDLGSRSVEIKNAIVETFKNDYRILLVTDSGSEGLNLQFCNTVINYDLPWNPQRIEQRIGRCHRYGQKNDVIVINLLNTENVADRRVYEILSQKFELFQGVFGASDKAIGLLESGENFEKRVLQIYQQCKSPTEFNKEFQSLEKELDRKRNVKFRELRNLISKTSEEIHKQELKEILAGVNCYFEDKAFWASIPKEISIVHYPIAYKTNKIYINDKVQHGYIIIGGFYNNQELLSPVLEAFDIDNNRLVLAESDIVQILSTLNNKDLMECDLEQSFVEGCSNPVYDEKMQQYRNSYRKLVMRNNIKIDNWVVLRCDAYNLQISEFKTELDELNAVYVEEKNFKAKIEIKKQMEQIKHNQDEMSFRFHEFTAEVQSKAAEMKLAFEKQFAIEPMLIAKIVVQF
jgi:Superfamily II DNA/RNA helicases, SNF2 family